MKSEDEVQEKIFKKAIARNIFSSFLLLIGVAIGFSHIEKTLISFADAVLLMTFVNLYVAHCFAFRPLRSLKYSYGNLYLFRKYAFLYESFFAVSLSLLLGTFPILFEYLQYTNITGIFWISFSTIWFGSSAASAKCIIDYSKVIWEEEAKKRGDKLVD